jgi:hypothetical protein
MEYLKMRPFILICIFYPFVIPSVLLAQPKKYTLKSEAIKKRILLGNTYSREM